LVQGAKRQVFSRVYLDLGGNYRDSILLASSPRSGSTWIANVINYRNNFRTVFEPFNSIYVPICNEFEYRQYLRPDNADERYLAPAQSIMAGRIRNKWVDQVNQIPLAKKRLIKDVRVNLFLKWLRDNFPEMPIILLLRHPCAVALSRIKEGWPSHIEELLNQRDLVDDFLGPFEEAIRATKTDFEMQIFLWCVENYVPLKQLRPDDVHLAFYERFCIDPHNEFDSLFRYIGLDYDSRVFIKMKQPVRVRQESAILTGESLTAGWQKHIREEQVKQALDILALFGLDTIYSSDPMPNMDAAQLLLAS
jgi:hypothetical protein